MADKQKNTAMMNKKGVGARHWIINIFLIGLFAFLIISFAVGFLVQNENSGINSDTRLAEAQVKLNNSLNYFSAATGESGFYGAFKKNSKPDSLQIFLILPGIINTMTGMIYLPFSTASAIMTLIMGETLSPAVTIVLSVITGIIFLTMIFLVYKVIRTGDSEH